MKIVIKIAVLLIVAGVAFYGGVLYKTSQTPATRTGAQGSRTGGRFTAGNNFVTGSVVAEDNQSITIKSADGSSRIIFYSGSTQVGEFVSGATTDLKVGQTVMATGTTNTDGSITAQSIQIRPTAPAISNHQ